MCALKPEVFDVGRVVSNGANQTENGHDKGQGQNHDVEHIAREVAQINQGRFPNGHQCQGKFEPITKELLYAEHVAYPQTVWRA